MTDEKNGTDVAKVRETIKLKTVTDKLMSFITKRNLIILGSLIFIAGAVWLNWYLFSSPVENGIDASGIVDDNNTVGNIGDALNADGVEETGDINSYFTATQLNRQRARDEAMEVLQLVLNSEDALDDAKSEAIAGIARIAADIECEANIESLITAKGFEECVAVLGNESASVIVKSNSLMQNEISQIKEIVYEAAGILPDKIKIIEKKYN